MAISRQERRRPGGEELEPHRGPGQVGGDLVPQLAQVRAMVRGCVDGNLCRRRHAQVPRADVDIQLTTGIRKVHDFLTVGAAAPLQEAGIVAMGFPSSYYAGLAALYQGKRDAFLPLLQTCGFQTFQPAGAYYVMADFSAISDRDDIRFAEWLLAETGVATVPGSSFYREPGHGTNVVRFAFCKRMETLGLAAELLQKIRP